MLFLVNFKKVTYISEIGSTRAVMRMAKKRKDKMQKKDTSARAHPGRTVSKEEAEVEGPVHSLGRELGADLGIVHGEEGPKVIESVKHCPSCGSRDIIFDSERGEYVCNGCGLVIEENVTDTGPEWRAFDTDQRNARARTGAPIKYMKPNKGLVTEIDMYNKDIRGAKLPSKRQAQLYRIRKWHKRASIASSSERNYLVALPELNRVASYLGLPDNVRESSALLYRNCVKNNLIRGRPIETVVNAALYATCRQAGMPRTLDEISQISGVPKKEIGRTYRVIAHELGLKIPLTDPISLRAQVRRRAQAERGGAGEVGAAAEAGDEEGPRQRKEPDRRLRGRGLHRQRARRREEDAEGGGRGRGSDRGHHKEQVQGAQEGAQHRRQPVEASA